MKLAFHFSYSSIHTGPFQTKISDIVMSYISLHCKVPAIKNAELLIYSAKFTYIQAHMQREQKQ